MNLEQLSTFFTTFLLNIELSWRLVFDSRVSLITKILFVAMALGYFAFPIDFIPDLFPVVGQADDLVVFIFVMLQFIKACPEEIVAYHKQSILGGDWKIVFLKFLAGQPK